MEKCRICNTEIPDGSKFCSECKDKEQFKTNESYLDDLLSSIMSNTETNSHQNSKVKDMDEGVKEELHTENTDESVEGEYISGLPFDVDLEDIQDFDQFNIMDDLNDSDEIMDLSKVLEMSDKIEIKNEELFGPSLDTTTNDDGFDENVVQSEINQMNEIDSEDIALQDILKELEQSDSETESKSINNIEDILERDLVDAADEQDTAAITQDAFHENMGLNTMGLDEAGIDEDILSLLNQMSDDDPIASGIVNMIKGTDGLEQNDTPSFTTDVGEVFSDALSAVSSLNDTMPMSEQNNSVDEIEEKKKLKKEKLKKLMVQSEEEQDANGKDAKKEKKGLLEKLFAKKKTNKNGKMTEKKAEPNEDQKENELEDAESVIKVSNHQDKKKSAKKVSKKAKKKTKALHAVHTDGDDNIQDGESKLVRKKGKKASTKLKKAKKKQTKKVKKEVQEIEVDLGKINPVAAAIVMVTFTLLALYLLSGTKAFAYSNSIKNATQYFYSQRYTKAYEELYGLNIKDEDAEIFNKIQTVMYVNKQLNSYNNFYAVGKYPEALDSLLKGLKRYERYIDLAIMYGIESDLDYVRGQILAELESKYNLSEDQAMQMIAIENETEYSKQIYDIINKLEK